MIRPIRLRWEGRILEAELEIRSGQAVLIRDGRRFESPVRRDGAWIELGPEQGAVRCGAVAGSRGVWVAHEGRAYFLERSHREAPAREAGASVDEIRAPMTGRVVAVAARSGAAVGEGDLLLTIEAMKMEFRLTAPEDGRIAEIACSEGDRVELGQLLVRLLPAGAKPAPPDEARPGK